MFSLSFSDCDSLQNITCDAQKIVFLILEMYVFMYAGFAALRVPTEYEQSHMLE